MHAASCPILPDGTTRMGTWAMGTKVAYLSGQLSTIMEEEAVWLDLKVPFGGTSKTFLCDINIVTPATCLEAWCNALCFVMLTVGQKCC
jgi:hypothetical protein